MNVRELVAPDVLPAVDAMSFVVLDAEVLASVRSSASAPVVTSSVVDRSDHLVPADAPVPIRIHRPVGVDGLLPCVYSIHGGGYVLGSHLVDDLLFERWCPELGIVGASVDYRLAPENPYPGPLDDCHAGLRWVYEHAEDLGVDRSRIGVYGMSAGGGLAAGLTLRARDLGGPSIAFQVLVSPMLDDRQLTPSSRLDGLPVWSRESNAFGWRSYLGELYGRPDVPDHAAPARCRDLSGLPPAFVAVGTLDGFRDEDVDYGLRLNHAGVEAEMHVYAGAPHGFQMARQSRLYRRSMDEMTEWLTRRIGHQAVRHEVRGHDASADP